MKGGVIQLVLSLSHSNCDDKGVMYGSDGDTQSVVGESAREGAECCPTMTT
jgi:hypothetical protein